MTPQATYAAAAPYFPSSSSTTDLARAFPISTTTGTLSEGLRGYDVPQYYTADETAKMSGSAALTQQYCNVPYQALSESTTNRAPGLAGSSDAIEELWTSCSMFLVRNGPLFSHPGKRRRNSLASAVAEPGLLQKRGNPSR